MLCAFPEEEGGTWLLKASVMYEISSGPGLQVITFILFTST